jgi:hypothetical protein
MTRFLTLFGRFVGLAHARLQPHGKPRQLAERAAVASLTLDDATR